MCTKASKRRSSDSVSCHQALAIEASAQQAQPQPEKGLQLTDGASQSVPMELQEAGDGDNTASSLKTHLSDAMCWLQEPLAVIHNTEEKLEELRAQRQEHSDVDEQLQEELERMIGASEGDFATLRTRAAENECKIRGTEKMLTECVARLEVALARGIAANESEKDALKACMKEDDSRMKSAKALTSKRAAHCEKLQTRIKAIESVLATLQAKLEMVGASNAPELN